MFFINLKIALRNIQRNKGFSFINIGGLAIGLTCCLLLLLYVNYEWSYDKQFKSLDRIYISMLNHTNDGTINTGDYTPSKLGPAALQNFPGIEAMARIDYHGNKLFSHEANKFKLNALNVDPSFLKIFNYTALSGDLISALNMPNGIILTESTSKKLFGDQDPIGQSLQWDNRKILKVTAVIKDLPKNQTFQFDVLQSWAFDEEVNPMIKKFEWGLISCQTVFKLKTNASFAATDVALRKLIKSNDHLTVFEAFLFPLAKHHLYNEFVNGKLTGGKIDQVKLFAFLAFCVLFIASINYMNLSTARSEKRAREVGVRKALGSTRKLLMGQFVLESLLFSCIAMLIAFALLELTLPYFNQLLDISVQINYGSYLFWGTLLLLVVFTGLLAGSYPAIYLSSFTPIKVLKGFKGAAGALSVRKALVIIQFSLSICMIICAIVIYTQIQFIKNKPLGFNENNLVQLELDGDFRDPVKSSLLKEELKKSGAIVSATQMSSSLISADYSSSDFVWPGKAANESVSLQYRSTGFDYVKTLGVKLIAGRDFSPESIADTSTSVVLNESAVKRMGLKNAVGSVIKWGNSPPLTIIGVIKDYSNDGAGSKTLPTVFYNNIGDTRVMLLRLNPAQALSTSLTLIREISQRLNPAYPADLQFIDQAMAEKLKNENLLSVLSNLFGGFCIFISCLGLLGLALYMAEHRQKEISIRKVLGADLQSILILLNKDFMKLVLISNLIAFPFAYILSSQWLQKYDYRIDISAWPFLLAAMMSLIIAILTVSLQTFKVAKANVIDSLKYE